MNTSLCDNWIGFSASVPGSGHIRRGLPCQDASAAITSPRPALIVCDGRGSASHSQDGALAAVKSFQTQIAVFEPMLTSILDNDNESQEQWETFARIMYRTLMQAKLDLAQEMELPENEFDFTVAFAIMGSVKIGCFQVGDGAIVLRQKGKTITAFPPDKGEFANQTHFLRENGELSGKYHTALFEAAENSGVAITSDGPEHLMFKLNAMTPGKVFGVMFDDLLEKNLCKQDIMDYLTRRDWENDPRGGDDRSLALLVQLKYQEEEVTNEIPADMSLGQPQLNENAEDEITSDASPDSECDGTIERGIASDTEVSLGDISNAQNADLKREQTSMVQNEKSEPFDKEKVEQLKMINGALRKSVVSSLLSCILATASAICFWNNTNLSVENKKLWDEISYLRNLNTLHVKTILANLQTLKSDIEAHQEDAIHNQELPEYDVGEGVEVQDEDMKSRNNLDFNSEN